MKFIQKTALAALVCALAAPAAQAATATLSVGTSVTLTDLDTDTSTTLSWAFLQGGNLSASVAPFSGLGQTPKGFGVLFANTTAGHSYQLTLPYSYTVSAVNAGDTYAAISLGWASSIGALKYSDNALITKLTGQSGEGSDSLNLLFTAAGDMTTVGMGSKVFAYAAAPVPEADVSALSVAGLAVVGAVVARRRKAQAAAAQA